MSAPCSAHQARCTREQRAGDWRCDATHERVTAQPKPSWWPSANRVQPTAWHECSMNVRYLKAFCTGTHDTSIPIHMRSLPRYMLHARMSRGMRDLQGFEPSPLGAPPAPSMRAAACPPRMRRTHACRSLRTARAPRARHARSRCRARGTSPSSSCRPTRWLTWHVARHTAHRTVATDAKNKHCHGNSRAL